MDIIWDNLAKAKIELMMKSVFLSTIALSIRHELSEEIPTAATDGTRIIYNKKFVERLSKEELAGLIAHECWHIALEHLTRRNGRDPKLWNCAGDYVINLMILNNGMLLPANGLVNASYANLTSDEVYELLEKNNPGAEPSMDDLMEVEPGSEQSQDVVDIIAKAVTQSKAAGKYAGEVPGHIRRSIDNLLNPKLDWRILLERFLTARIKYDYSWRRPNRRYLPELFLPSQYSEGIGKLAFAVDTSGSINNDQLKQILSEIHNINEIFKPSSMLIIGCDYAIGEEYEVTEGSSILDLSFIGGGGTSFDPVFHRLQNEDIEALVYFTDLYANTPSIVPDYPVLWVCNSNHAPAAFGETIYVE